MRRLPLALVVVCAAPLAAQSLLSRPPNLGGTWVPDAGVVRFDFIHRFWVTPGPNSGVINYPTFTLAVGLPAHLGLGLRYATKGSDPNESEVYARWRAQRSSFAVSVTPAYNVTLESIDGEVGVDWTKGPLTLVGALRGMSHAFGDDRARAAAAGGAVFRLNDYVAVGGDLASMLDTDPGEDPAWSVGLLFVIPGSPHTFSLHASNVGANTIQGSSRRDPQVRLATSKPLYGFEFTIPLHLKRFSPWFKRSPQPVALGAAPGGTVASEIRMAAYKFQTDSLTISAGQTVRWTNGDPVEHTVTFDGPEPGSPPIPPNGTFNHRFDAPGRYPYHCTPHPYMKGVVVVK
ncbi:MAG TPA: plastocyanin/azurin family copper-binding protein [Gemmatimonadales bacterium]|nr:plastocyanin/azurin family copper-binding protein [Gemmatimonadales bacterium]